MGALEAEAPGGGGGAGDADARPGDDRDIGGARLEAEGVIAPGRPANICVFDPDATWAVDPDRSASRSRNTPYAGRTLTGRVRHTLLDGAPVVVDAEPQR